MKSKTVLNDSQLKVYCRAENMDYEYFSLMLRETKAPAVRKPGFGLLAWIISSFSGS